MLSYVNAFSLEVRNKCHKSKVHTMTIMIMAQLNIIGITFRTFFSIFKESTNLVTDDKIAAQTYNNNTNVLN